LITRRFTRDWLPVVLWTGIIALESFAGSSAHTGALLYRIASFFFGHIDPVRFEHYHHILRKLSHFLGYGVLGYLLFRAVCNTLSNSTRASCAAVAIALTFVVASLDEFHQSFSPGRTALFSDVLLDTCGAIALVILAIVAHRRVTARTMSA
jgi:VanZ family protein